MHLSGKQKTFSQFFASFLKSILNFELFQKRMTLIAEVFPKLRTPKHMFTSMSKKSRFKGAFKRSMVNAPKHCGNFDGRTFTIFSDRCEGN